MSATEHAQKSTVVRAPVGLRISIGESMEGRKYPGRIDYFRAKAGQENEHQAAAERFHADPPDGYGPEPHELDDLYFLSNEIGDVLDVRIKAWGKSGVKIVGLTNFASLDSPDEFERRCNAWDDEIVYFPRDVTEVPRDRRESWNGEPIHARLDGPDDPRISRFEMKVETTLRFCAPRVIGLGTVVEITSGGRKTRRNLYASIREIHHAFHGNLIGPKFRLSVRPQRTNRWDAEKRSYLPTTVHALVIETTMTVNEILDAVERQRVALGAGAPLEQRALPAGVLGLPLPTDEDQRLRDEPTLHERPDDALLNRIAVLQGHVDGDPVVFLQGAYGVDSAEQLSPEQAVQYARGLEAFLISQEAEPVDGEVVPDDEIDAAEFFEVPR